MILCLFHFFAIFIFSLWLSACGVGENELHQADFADVSSLDLHQLDADDTPDISPALDMEPPVRIGNPSWQVEDIQLFYLPIRNDPSDNRFGALVDFISCYLEQEFLILVRGNSVIPTLPRDAPYRSNLARTLQECTGSTSTQRYSADRLSNQTGVGLAFALAPDLEHAQRGSSPYFADGPIISSSVFPIRVSHILRQGDNATEISPNSAAIGLDKHVDPSTGDPYTLDGYSHLPILTIALFQDIQSILGTTIDWLSPDLIGDYVVDVSVTDPAGNGWLFSIPFEVE